jgi:hypothetical protein
MVGDEFIFDGLPRYARIDGENVPKRTFSALTVSVALICQRHCEEDEVRRGNP